MTHRVFALIGNILFVDRLVGVAGLCGLSGRSARLSFVGMAHRAVALRGCSAVTGILSFLAVPVLRGLALGFAALSGVRIDRPAGVA
jgi:hypothetical protein